MFVEKVKINGFWFKVGCELFFVLRESIIAVPSVIQCSVSGDMGYDYCIRRCFVWKNFVRTHVDQGLFV